MSETHASRAAPAARPTGTVAFLFSDIEGSTLRWELHREHMAAALRRHDAIVRSAFEARGGYVFKTLGDAFCAAFTTVPAALAAACEAQKRLTATDFTDVDGLRVRMAVHAGTPDVRDGDYFGPAVNRVARLLAISHGGQIIVSAAAADLGRDGLPLHATLVDRGLHRLKDLAHSERVFELVVPGVPADFPPLRSLDATPHNLPLQLNAFVGRTTEIAEIELLLGDARLVTLVGAGGIGKTRTALHVAAELAAEIPDGVWFVELAPLGDGATIVAALAALFDVAATPGRSLLEGAVARLRYKSTLLLFDNCEHIVADAAAVVERILREAPKVRVLATSREALGIAGERVYRLPSLAAPPAGSVFETVDDALRYDSIALFVERARAVAPSFELTAPAATTIGDICRRLDGIPFAIELAAPRLRLLTVQQLLDRLKQRFRLLTGGARNAPTRQQTMRAMIDWSFDLLAQPERTAFLRLAIFNDGWTLDAAGIIAADGGLDGWDVVDLVTALVDKSLVVEDRGRAERRFRMHESTRDYALERLAETPGFATLGRRHAAYYAAFGRRLALARKAMSDTEWLDAALGELENVRAALAWSIDEGHDVALGVSLLAAFVHLWTLSRREEGARWADAALGKLAPDAPPVIVAQLRLVHAICASVGVQRASRSEDALAAARAAGDIELLGAAIATHARNLVDAARLDEATALLREAVAIQRGLGDARSLSIALTYLADIARWTGDAAAARALYDESTASAAASRAERAQALALGSFAEFEYDCGHFDEASALALRAAALFERIHDIQNVVQTYCNLAAYALACDRVAEARERAGAALAMLREQDDPFMFAIVVEHVAVADGLEGNFERAARLVGFTERRYRTFELLREETERRGYERVTALLSGRFDAAEFDRLRALGARATDDAILAEIAP